MIIWSFDAHRMAAWSGWWTRAKRCGKHTATSSTWASSTTTLRRPYASYNELSIVCTHKLNGFPFRGSTSLYSIYMYTRTLIARLMVSHHTEIQERWTNISGIIWRWWRRGEHRPDHATSTIIISSHKVIAYYTTILIFVFLHIYYCEIDRVHLYFSRIYTFLWNRTALVVIILVLIARRSVYFVHCEMWVFTFVQFIILWSLFSSTSFVFFVIDARISG